MNLLKKVFGSKTTSNNKLLKALKKKAANPNEATNRELFDALFDSNLIVPTLLKEGFPEGEGEHPLTLKKDTTFQCVGVTGPNGTRAIPVFTDVDALAASGLNNPHYVVLEAAVLSDVGNTAGSSGLLINMGSREQLYVPFGGLETPTKVKAGETIRMSRVPSLQEETIRRLKESCSDFGEIKEGYLFMCALSDQPLQPTIGIVFTSKPASDSKLRQIFQHIGSATNADPFLKGEVSLLPLYDAQMINMVKSSGSLFYSNLAT